MRCTLQLEYQKASRGAVGVGAQGNPGLMFEARACSASACDESARDVSVGPYCQERTGQSDNAANSVQGAMEALQGRDNLHLTQKSGTLSAC